ncbi:6978_t:CDS:2, partial [Dentiscutata heterogama]
SQLKLTGGSTSNLISHLSNIHGITKDGPKLSEHDDSIFLRVRELDPMFILPSEKRIKQMIHTLYNQYAGKDIISDWGLTGK